MKLFNFRSMTLLVRIIFIILFSLIHLLPLQAALKPGEDETLLTENFLGPLERDQQGLKGWAFHDGDGSETGLILTPHEKGVKIMVSAKEVSSYTRLERIMPIDFSRLKEEGVAVLVNVVEAVGRHTDFTLMIPESIDANGPFGPTKVKPGQWTFPRAHKLKSNRSFRMSLYFYEYNQEEPGYQVIESIRLISGLAPGAVLWSREENPDWTVPFKKDEMITIRARLGELKSPPSMRFIYCLGSIYKKINLSQDFDLSFNDSGKEGDESAGDGIWTVQFKYKPSGEKMLSNPMIEITTDQENYSYFGLSPWPQESALRN